MEPKELVPGTLIQSGDHFGVILCEAGGGQSCRTEPSTFGVWRSLQVDSVRTELSYRTPSLCHTAAWFCENSPTPPHIKTGFRNFGKLISKICKELQFNSKKKKKPSNPISKMG